MYSKQQQPSQLVWAIVILSIGGLAAILGLMALMRQALDFSRGQIAGFTVLGFVIVLAAEVLLIWLLVRSLKGVQAPDDDGRPGIPTTGGVASGGGPNTPREPQPLERSAINRRVNALFKAMSTDFLLREQFVTGPAQVLSEYVHGTRMPPEEAATSDQLLYSVMSNQSLLGWVRDYSIRTKGVVPARSQFVGDFSRAVAGSGGDHIVLALTKASVGKHNVFDSLEALLPAIFATFDPTGGIMGQTEMSTGHTTGTEKSTGHIFSQTEMSTGHTTGTEKSTGHIFSQTEMSTGHTTGTEKSTGHIFGQTEMSTGHTTGTEKSTGHIFSQTEMSTGHTTGTEKSTGHIFGPEVFGRGYQLVTLAALADYSIGLRNRGLLDAF